LGGERKRNRERAKTVSYRDLSGSGKIGKGTGKKRGFVLPNARCGEGVVA